MREIKYSPQLDGLRAVCIIFTLFNHIDGVPFFINGSMGVDVFFVLSGFLITGILLKNTWGDLGGYYIRRFFRITPVYYLGLFLTVLLTLITYHFKIGDSKIDQLHNIIVPSLLFSRELVSAPTLFGQAWTIGIEEKFYVVWPLVFLLLPNSKNRLCFLFGIVTAAIFLSDGMSLRGYGGIALGCVSAILYFARGFFIKTNIAVGIFIITYLFCLYMKAWFGNIFISMASALLIPSLFASKSLYSEILSRPLIVFIGKLTFSIYMFHVLIFNAIKILLSHFGVNHWLIVFVVGYFFSIMIAWLVFLFYEYPLICYGKNLATKANLIVKPQELKDFKKVI